MDSKQIRGLEGEERERARTDARRAYRAWKTHKDPVRLLRTIYGLEDQRIGAFLNTGPLENTILGQRYPTIVTVFPFADETTLRRAYGVTAQRLNELIIDKHIIPLAQMPARYEHLQFLHPVFRHRPPNYYLRSVYFYAIFFDGTTELVDSEGVDLSPGLKILYEKAKQNRILGRILSDDNKAVREFYDRMPHGTASEKVNRIKINIWYRYASVAAFAGEDVTDYILESYKTHEALGVLLDLHFMFDHAWTQGLLANMHNTVNAHNTDWLAGWRPTRLWWRNSLARVLFANIPFPTLLNPSMAQLDAAREDRYHETIEAAVTRPPSGSLESLRAELRLKISEIDAKLERIAAVGQKTVFYRNMASVLFGAAAVGLPTNSVVGAGLGAAAGYKLSDSIITRMFDSYQRYVRTHNVDTHLVGHLSTVWAGTPLRYRVAQPPDDSAKQSRPRRQISHRRKPSRAKRQSGGRK